MESKSIRVWVTRSSAAICGLLLAFIAFILAVLGSGTEVPALIVGVGVVSMLVRSRWVRVYAGIIVVVALGVVMIRALKNPSNDRAWQEPLTITPEIKIDGNHVVIEGLRDFRWRADGSHEPRWEERSFNLGHLDSVDLIIEPFGPSPLMAHTMLSFDFGPDGRLLLSIEARKEVGESYDLLPGGLNEFELIYLFEDERDGLGQRAHRGHRLYAFPTKIDPLRLRAFFLGLCSTANNLRGNPRFYRVVRDNCTSAWIDHADHLSVHPLGMTLDTVFTGRVGMMLHRRGAIDTDLSYEQALEVFRIDHMIMDSISEPDFSEAIRAGRQRDVPVEQER